jgi:isopentenyl-diphosphate delta-isomerase type 1
MSDDIFDVVDERDEPVARLPRREVHARSLRHRAVHVMVFNSRGEIFLQKRSPAKDLFPGVWDSSCSGHVDAGEDYDPAAVRELGEELGLAVEAPPERWFRVEARRETGWEFVWVYRLRAEGPFVLNPAEIDAGEWLAPAEVTRRVAERPQDYAGSFRLLWSMIAGLRGSPPSP